MKQETEQKQEEGQKQDPEQIYRKFTGTKQQKLRLEAALQGFFLAEENGAKAAQKEAYKEEYKSYLKTRIRPAMEALIREEETEKMEALAQFGWFGAKELETFIRSAREQGKLSALVWLLKLKQEKYGYQDKDFSL
ncbi:MAG: hypothetical protein Q4C91_04060 [Eubacteriales bacterium]|nr:hypothetical protein [Eubacteriales bacterium]